MSKKSLGNARALCASIAKGAKEMLGAEHLNAVADKGFFKKTKECVDNGISLTFRSRAGTESAHEV